MVSGQLIYWVFWYHVKSKNNFGVWSQSYLSDNQWGQKYNRHGMICYVWQVLPINKRLWVVLEYRFLTLYTHIYLEGLWIFIVYHIHIYRDGEKVLELFIMLPQRYKNNLELECVTSILNQRWLCIDVVWQYNTVSFQRIWNFYNLLEDGNIWWDSEYKNTAS